MSETPTPEEKAATKIPTTKELMLKTYGEESMTELEAMVPDGNVDKKLYLAMLAQQVLGFEKTEKGYKLRPLKDLMLVMYFARRTGLDPLAKQFYVVYYKNKKTGIDEPTIISSIDSFRLQAQNTGQYAGQKEPEYGEMKKVIMNAGTQYQQEIEAPDWALVTVLKSIDGHIVETPAKAYWDEYAPKVGASNFWLSKPRLMLAKCAEELALRKAFPRELAGQYGETEMVQAETEKATTTAKLDLPTPKRFTKEPEQEQK